ncbi:uncharacterized protein LOC130297783 [Hyla sarda]|uniref:uncharacterized protein LOC130297783 n=1 Tax=Hyla sarda TaxID=327740 RepID=UPI0024C243B7|nr:uncharacterized protein LOC130297783 [Hyla sarda]XP_056406648.1 uncharacterized protein LOC130297783 [Hyla sarda]
MPSCIVKGCTHYTGMKSTNPLLTMHVFPRELSRIKLWLQQIGQIGDIDAFAAKVFDESRTGKYRICSAHFAPGSYISQGSRIVLKHDAIPTLFPGIHPRPPPDWKPQPAQANKPEPTGKSDKMDAPAPKASTQRKETVPAANVDCQKRLQEGARRNQGAKQGRTQGPPQGTLLDINGRYTGGLSKVSGHKTKPDELSYNWSPRADAADENKRALLSLENVMVALLQHLGDAPLSSRAQKQKTGRLLNQTAEIVSLLTGEEWTVVKKNSHISKFYNMIREVPIKCGDVAVFFSMDEWDYIEDHEDQYKHVMVEEPEHPQLNGGSGGMKTDFLPETSRDPRPNFNDIDFGHLFQNSVPSPVNREKYEETIKDLRILEMSCSSDDDMDPPSSDRVDSPTGHKDIELDEPQSPESPPPPTDKHKEIRKDDKEEIPNKTKPGKTSEVEPEVVPDTPASNPSKQSSPDVTADPVPKIPPAPDTPPRKESPPAADVIEESPEASSELWIAQDGTTSSTWIPQDDPRPKGRNCSRYGNGPRIQCPVSLSGSTTICRPELKRPELSMGPHCHRCDITFPDQLELELHQLTHSKMQRL